MTIPSPQETADFAVLPNLLDCCIQLILAIQISSELFVPSSVGKSEFYPSRDLTGLWAHATLHGDGEGGVGAVMEGGVAL
jgi:hypothetical protein